MDGQLIQLGSPHDSSPELILLVKGGRQEVAEWRAEVRRSQRDNLELRQQVGYWKSRHRDALGRVTAPGQEVEQLEGGKRRLQADLFGRRSETRPLNLTYRPTERLPASWRLLGLGLAPGTVTDGLSRLEVLLEPIDRAIQERDRLGDLHQGDETRWRVFIATEGKEGYGWWLWVLLGPDTVVYLLDAGRDRGVPEGRDQAESRGVLVVDRYAAYKAMSWVKDGVIVLAFCWAHVRRDVIRVGKGWPEHEAWALRWLGRIRPRIGPTTGGRQRSGARRPSGRRMTACVGPWPR